MLKHLSLFKVPFFIALLFLSGKGYAQEITLNTPVAKPATIFQLGTAVNPAGQSITCDSRSLLIDGKPVVPVMGEIHYTRCHEDDWKRELLKMKAGGITVAASYVFWIHHEEEKGVLNWSGTRDLRKFVEACREVDLPVILRIGPFCHGEVRNGGIPDWIIEGNYKIRSTDPAFLEEVKRWFYNIYNQVEGLLWKDGGPVIGIQIDNEHRGPWQYLKAVKEIACTIGFDVPLYTRTGWPQLTTPATFGEILPLYGDYSDGFWDRSLKDMPGEYAGASLFRPSRISSVIASEQFTAQTGEENKSDLSYPYFTCELGGGMMPSYHRRIHIYPLDIHAMALVKVGSGSNLPGYYMYHGGTNPEGKYHTLNEKQNSPYMNHNDLPAMTYDFQTPLGEFGQINEHYHWLRRTHTFLADFGEELSGMDATFPENPVTDAKGTDDLRWSVRSNGKSGYLFVNNYQRMRELSGKKETHFTIRLPESTLQFPASPITIPSGSSFFFPFNLDFAGITIKYATAQPIASIKQKNIETLFMAEVKGIPAEVMLDSKKEGERLFKDLQPGVNCVIETKTENGKTLRIIILDEATSLQSYKVKASGNEYMFITSGGLSNLDTEVYLEEWDKDTFTWSVYPAASFTHQGKKVSKTTNGLFTTFKATQPLQATTGLKIIKSCDAAPARTVNMGGKNVAEQPSDDDFDLAAQWKIEGLENLPDTGNLFLRVTYEGDVARLYAGGKLIQDNFYNGKPMYARVNNLIGKDTRLHILPLEKDYPIYFQHDIREKLEKAGSLLELHEVKLVERNTISINLSPSKK